MRQRVFAAAVRGLVLVGVLGAGAAACGYGTSSNGGSNAAYCDDLQALNGNIDQLQALRSGNPSASEVESVLTDAQSNLNKAAQDASGTASIKFTAIEAAYSALLAAFGALPTTLSANEAFQQVQPEITTLVTALRAATAGSGCPSGSA